jgi:hypothetical protein
VQGPFDVFRKGCMRLEGFAADVLFSEEEVLDWGQLQGNAKYKGYLPDSRDFPPFWKVFGGLPEMIRHAFCCLQQGGIGTSRRLELIFLAEEATTSGNRISSVGTVYLSRQPLLSLLNGNSIYWMDIPLVHRE